MTMTKKPKIPPFFVCLNCMMKTSEKDFNSWLDYVKAYNLGLCKKCLKELKNAGILPS